MVKNKQTYEFKKGIDLCYNFINLSILIKIFNYIFHTNTIYQVTQFFWSIYMYGRLYTKKKIHSFLSVCWHSHRKNKILFCKKSTPCSGTNENAKKCLLDYI